MSVPAPDQVLDVQDGGDQLLLKALLWGHDSSEYTPSPMKPSGPQGLLGQSGCSVAHSECGYQRPPSGQYGVSQAPGIHQAESLPHRSAPRGEP